MRFATTLFPCLFILFALSASFASAKDPILLDRLEASVNSSVILLSDLIDFKKTAQLRAQLDPLFSGTAVAKNPEGSNDSEIVNFLIQENLISGQFPIKDADVEQEINSIQANNRFDRAALTNALKEQGFKFADYFELIRTSLAKRNLIDRDIRTKVHISDDDVKNYFYNEYAGKDSNRSYRIQMISVSKQSYISEKDAYEAAKKALAALKSGEEFSEVAKRMSDAPTAPVGGDLGFLAESDMSPFLKKGIVGLKVGQTTDMLRSPDGGFLILKLADIRTGQEDQLKEADPKIRNLLATSEYQRQIDFWIEREQENAHIHKAGQDALPNLKTKK